MMNLLILLAGLVIYSGYGIWGLVWLLAATGISYGLGLLIPKHKWTMYLGVTAQAIILVLLKLQPVTGMELLAPVGVSYFSLHIISYLVDIYRGKIQPERNILRYSLYIGYFQHLSIGPIENYDNMRRALAQRKITWDGISMGFARVLWGLFKKLVIASRAGVIVSAISADPQAYQGGYALLAMVLYSLQLYTDFSGGIDTVLGVSQMLGLRLSENFDRPYFSESVQEFWRRWHMTLGTWLKNYVYIPLGGNRKGTLRKGINFIITFLVSGLWHGVHYLLWGLLNGIFVLVGKRLQTPIKTLNRIGTFLVISFLWSFFVWTDTLTAVQSALSVFTQFNYGDVVANIGSLGLTLTDWIVMLAAGGMLWIYDWKHQAACNGFAKAQPATRLAFIGLLGLVVLLFGMYGIGFEASGFIYGGF
jgi:D-alanyl-lipoteichoic acid acyltransferase DltB (MBOAT superfamily)